MRSDLTDESDDLCPRIIKTDYESAAILAFADEFPGIEFDRFSVSSNKFRSNICCQNLFCINESFRMIPKLFVLYRLIP